MSNIDITNVDMGGIEIQGGKFRDELLAFAGTDTFAKGTILARRAVALAVVASAFSGGGDGTITAASVAPGTVIPLVGAYTLRCTAAVTNGGVFRLEDPNGAIVASDLRLTVANGGATIFEAAGLLFTVNEGTTDFSLGATATLTVSADGKLVPFDPAGAGGAQVPVAVLPYEVSRTGAGNVPIRALVAGEVKKERLIIDADGDGDNITSAIIDALRSYGIVATDTQQLAALDNQ